MCGEQTGGHCVAVVQWGSSPRVRGTGINSFAVPTTILGSSPRVRGTVAVFNALYTAFRIIPACAGNSSGRSTKRGRSRDHPRVCGEQPVRLRCRGTSRGSSPRVRGTVLPLINVWCIDGIIPACAGNSVFQRTCFCWERDHPRVCGEQDHSSRLQHNSPGSSPRVRGTDNTYKSKSNLLGIIPACAGNSADTPINYNSWRDHPRVCGEQLSQCSTRF